MRPVHWYDAVSQRPHPSDGMWIVKPQLRGNAEGLQVIHLDGIARAVHLIPCYSYGNRPLPPSFHFSQLLDYFSQFYGRGDGGVVAAAQLQDVTGEAGTSELHKDQVTGGARVAQAAVEKGTRWVNMLPSGRFKGESAGRMAARAITGAMKGTATAIMETHAQLALVHIAHAQLCERALTRMASLHVLTQFRTFTARQDEESRTRHTHSPMEELLLVTELPERGIQTVTPAMMNYDPLPCEIYISSNKEHSLKVETADTSAIKIYSDGSGVEGLVGAAAAATIEGLPGKELQYRLGPLTKFTMCKAEAVGVMLVLHILGTMEPKDYGLQAEGGQVTATIALDNQSVPAVRAPKAGAGQYLILNIRGMIAGTIARSQRNGREQKGGQKRASRGEESWWRELLRELRGIDMMSANLLAVRQKIQKKTEMRWKQEGKITKAPEDPRD
ncbi:hypothetical protein BDV98DRAFT_627614 [Pterulicium gracile]|uniref:Uncharacterized protein n=1 Tax=Pterulicium gracile TaxID=1884261 RepID=A0A5C3QCG2_9AGAR|nr:hypothetical protein BDV98DRAFT_627614 [Pterula gracilis]